MLRIQNFTLKTKVNSLEKKIPDATTLIHINQCNTVNSIHVSLKTNT